MKLIAIALVVFVSFALHPSAVSAQKTKCACKKVVETDCGGGVECTGGCTALCGEKVCSAWCAQKMVYARISVKFTQKTGKEIAVELAKQSHREIVFKPYQKNANKPLDLEIRSDDVMNAFRALDKLGRLTIGGVDFRKGLLPLYQKAQSGKNFSLTLAGPVSDAVDTLAFISGHRFRIQSGDRQTEIDLALNNLSLKQMLDAVSTAARVTIVEDER